MKDEGDQSAQLFEIRREPDQDELLDRMFEAIWCEYPRRIEKKGALQAFKATVRRGAEPDTLRRAVENYALRCKGTDTRFIKHPKTFFGTSEPWRDYLTLGQPDEDDDRYYDDEGEEIDETSWGALQQSKFLRSDEARRWT